MTQNIFRISDKKGHGVTTLSWRIESHKLGKKVMEFFYFFVKRKKRDRRIEEPQRNCKWNEFLAVSVCVREYLLFWFKTHLVIAANSTFCLRLAVKRYCERYGSKPTIVVLLHTNFRVVCTFIRLWTFIAFVLSKNKSKFFYYQKSAEVQITKKNCVPILPFTVRLASH